jgi:hypothetical protein
MSTTDQFLLALQAYRDIQTELHQEEQPRDGLTESPTDRPDLAPPPEIPDGSLLLGLADDGLPVMLDLYDPAPGPILVAGDGGSGKTAFLQSLARASDRCDPGDIQFAILTPFPEEWAELETLSNCLGIWPVYHLSADEFLSRLVNWAEALPQTRQVVLLIVDGLDLMAGNGLPFLHDLRWLLMNGPERQVWPVVSVNPGRFPRLQAWLEYFRTRVIGHVKQSYNARLLLDHTEIDPADLMPGVQFGLAQAESWLKFILPPLG